jgi:hypothetical protein
MSQSCANLTTSTVRPKPKETNYCSILYLKETKQREKLERELDA